MYDRYGIQPSVDELKAIADRCYAREWIEHMYIGSGRHDGLKLTAKGIGVAISKRKSDEVKKSRSFFKKASDYIEDHKGIFLLLASMIALVSLVTTILSKGGSKSAPHASDICYEALLSIMSLPKFAEIVKKYIPNEDSDKELFKYYLFPALEKHAKNDKDYLAIEGVKRCF